MGETAPVTIIHNKTSVFANIFSSITIGLEKIKTIKKQKKRKLKRKEKKIQKKKNFKRETIIIKSNFNVNNCSKLLNKKINSRMIN